MTKLIQCLKSKNNSCNPVWFMRQAGRYLPEFKKIRSQNLNFIKLCLNSDLSSEITLQPLKRFDLDAAIIFSDILIVPYALGQDVKFDKEKGPILSNFNLKKFIDVTEYEFSKNLAPVYQAIKKTRNKLNNEKSLISFVGAPWTLIVYMLGFKKNKSELDLSKIVSKKKELKLIFEKLNLFLCTHIKNQIEAGADTVQVFDSWAGLLPDKHIEDYCIEPNKKLVDFCKANSIPVICFPKGLKEKYLKFVEKVKPDCLNIDYDLDPKWANDNLHDVCIQGGMNPKILMESDKTIYKEAEKYLKIFKDRPYIFNLGHGLLPETNPEKLGKLIKFVKEYK